MNENSVESLNCCSQELKVENTVLDIAIIGQPNCGKTSLFNRLTGASQQVGNWPGVTVEQKIGQIKTKEGNLKLVDLPGIYSLSTYTIEEKVTRKYLLKENPNLLINIIDATNLERQLFLTLQVLMLGIPTLLVLNMMDEVKTKGMKIDLDRLQDLLGVPVFAVTARDGEGLLELKGVLGRFLKNPILNHKPQLPKDDIQELLQELSFLIKEYLEKDDKEKAAWFALKFLESDTEVEDLLMQNEKLKPLSLNFRQRLQKLSQTEPQIAIPNWIYGITRGVDKEVVKNSVTPKSLQEIISDFVDLIALHPVLGILFFFVIMFLMFQVTFGLGNIIIFYLGIGMNWVQGLFGFIRWPLLKSLVSDGLISGVGNVLLLLPYIFLMFIQMSFLEDSGYIARAAFVMDRFMHKIGLHGKSFIPLIMGFGCNVPAVMAARSLETENERLKTILMVPFISCSARLTVFTLIAGAVFGKKGGLVVFALYFSGILIAILTGLLLKNTLLKDKSAGLIMELPPYRTPHLGNSLKNTWVEVKSYLTKAGTIILVASLVLWILSYFPLGVAFGGEKSLIGLFGKKIAFLLHPLGFDWRMSVALITGFVAKEVVISTLGVLYHVGDNVSAYIGVHWNPVVALGFLVFNLIYIPCMATIAVIRAETKSWKWTIISVVYGITLAWVASFLVVKIGFLFIA